MRASKRKAILALADGTVFKGRAFGADAETTGELVFHTSSTGYQEILTDPGAASRLVVFAYPEIGNSGMNDEDRESEKVHAAGVIVRHLALAPSNHRSERSLEEELAGQGVPGIEGIDTRMLVRRLRDQGPQMAVLSTRADALAADLVSKAKALAPLAGFNLVETVTTRAIYELAPAAKARFHVVAYDFGIKRSMLRLLLEQGCRVTVVPATTPSAQTLALAPDGIFLSSGPGNPAVASDGTRIVRELLGKAPIFGICFGHQLLAQAISGSTHRMKHGHHGINQPVKDLASGKVAITSQAHAYAVDEKSLAGTGALVTHSSVHDGCVEGIEIPGSRAFGVQFHPESSPGPHDSLGLFDRFAAMMMESGR